MKSITKSDLAKVIRTNLDELGVNESMMMGGSDDAMLDEMIWNVAGECADEIHSVAPVQLLDGINLLYPKSPYLDYEDIIAQDKVLIVGLTKEMLRLVLFQTTDSDYIVTETIHESSPEGRMQLDPHVRGTYDAPKLVVSQNSSDKATLLKYYSLKDELTEGENADGKLRWFVVIFRQFGATDSVDVAEKVTSHFYNLVTAKVLTIMGDQRAQEYYNKAKFV